MLHGLPSEIGHIFDSASLHAQPLLLSLAALTILLFLLFNSSLQRVLPMRLTEGQLKFARTYVLIQISSLLLILISWYIDANIYDIPFLLSPFALILLIVALLYGFRLVSFSYLLITIFFIYYLVEPRYTFSSTVVSNAIVIYTAVSLLLSTAIGLLFRRYQKSLGLRVRELRELNWRTRERLAIKSEEEGILKVIYKSTLAIGSSQLSIQSVSKIIVQEARRLVKVPCAGIAFQTATGEISCDIISGSYAKNEQRLLLQKILNETVKIQESLSQAPAIMKIPKIVTQKNEKKMHHPFSEVLLTPIDISEQFVVLFMIRKRNEHEFTEKDVHKMKLFAAHASFAIRNAQHHEDLEKLMQARDQFSSAVAHELKTPLSTIKLYTQLLIEKTKGQQELAEYRKGLQVIDEEVNRLTTQINSLVDFARIESGKIRPEKKIFSLRKACKGRVDVLQKLYPDHPFTFTSTVSHAPIFADQIRIEQIITNLLSNAARYSKEGKPIVLRLSRRSNDYMISVKDQGIGLLKDQVKQIFEPFYQVKHTEKFVQLEKGLGLGLYIAKGIVQLHNGKIWVESEPGKGSTFYVTLSSLKPATEEDSSRG